MTAKDLYRHFLTELETIFEKGEAANICSMLFENKAGLSRPRLIKDPMKVIDNNTVATLTGCLLELKKHKPIQYILGEAWFYKMKLKVSPAVLIPRPETEELADTIIRYLKNNPSSSLLDIGTGSGCLAIAVKRNIPHMMVTAIDVSEAALAIAIENAQVQETAIDFKCINFLDETNWGLMEIFDVIVSNPPYIPEQEQQSLEKNVTEFEPHTALFVADETPLIFYEKITSFAEGHLSVAGKVFLETHEKFAVEVSLLFDPKKYTVEIRNDLQGRQRMVIATRHSL